MQVAGVLRFSARYLASESGMIYLEDLAPAYKEGQFRINLNIYLLICLCLLIFIAFFPAHSYACYFWFASGLEFFLRLNYNREYESRNMFCHTFRVSNQGLKTSNILERKFCKLHSWYWKFALNTHSVIRLISYQGVLNIIPAFYSEGNVFECASTCGGFSYICRRMQFSKSKKLK